jgi:hypothetical protein
VRGALDVESIQPPDGGLAPGWRAGIARRQEDEARHSRLAPEALNEEELSPAGR